MKITVMSIPSDDPQQAARNKLDVALERFAAGQPYDEGRVEAFVVNAFNGIAPDLAQACSDAGEPARIHVDDAADAVYNYVHDRLKSIGMDASFKLLKRVLKKHAGGRQYLYL